MITRLIKNDTLMFAFRVFVGEKDELNAKIASKGGEPLSGDATMVHWPGECYMELYIIPDAGAGLIAHESLHLANSVFCDIGQMADSDNDEVLAYLLQWIVNQVEKVLSQYQVNKRGGKDD